MAPRRADNAANSSKGSHNPNPRPTAAHRRPQRAVRGHFADRMRELAESHGMSLSKLLKDAILVYEGDIAAGYQPGTSLARWTAERREQASDA